MNSVIGESQMAVVENRQILDSFVIADEIIVFLKKSRDGGPVVKMDFEKAYDSLDHNFLDCMLEGMGFGVKWRQWMKYCIASPMISVLVNGSSTRQFGLERGLRQGDSLSPFLFNVAVEGLSALFMKAEELNMVKDEVFGCQGVHISHLQSVDDTIIFLQPNVEYLVNARCILRCFELASGLRINFHKSCVVKVGKEKENEENWALKFRCLKANLPISYLGLTLGGKPNTKFFWQKLIQRIENRLAQWKRLFLNKGGRLVLIKAVIASIPNYFMSVFRIPSWPGCSKN